MATRALLTASALAALFASAAAGAGPPPTSGRCAGAWNLRPSAPVLAAVRGRAWQATVKDLRGVVFTDTVAGGAATTTSRPARGCVIVFFLPRTTVTVTGTWRNDGVAVWRRYGSRSATPNASGNACVAPDGTLHRVGRFDAASRCR